VRGYLRMWRQNLVSLTVIVAFVGAVALMIYLLAGTNAHRPYPGNGSVPTINTTTNS